VAADTDSATPEGLPWQLEAKLANFVSNFELGDGVARNGPLPPTPTFSALAAPGRNPADIMIPILTGSEAPGGDDDDAVRAGGNSSGGGTFQAATDDDEEEVGTNLVQEGQQVTIERIKPPPEYIPEDLVPILAQAEAENRRNELADLFDPPKQTTVPTELERVRGAFQRALNEPPPTYNSSRVQWTQSYDQRLLEWYRKVLREMAAVGDALQRGGGAELRRRPGYEGVYANIRGRNNNGTLATGPPISPVVFPVLWPELSKAIKYSIDNYIFIGADPIAKGFTLIPPFGQNGLNLRDFFWSYTGPPWTLLAPDVFHDNDRDRGLYTILHTIVHEPLHDFIYDHDDMRNLLPTKVPPDDGEGEDAFTRFWNFLLQARDQNGVSLFTKILEVVGPPPPRP
jgi:hypothetical protein